MYPIALYTIVNTLPSLVLHVMCPYPIVETNVTQ